MPFSLDPANAKLYHGGGIKAVDERAVKTVKCRCGHLKAEATYEVLGQFLHLTSPFGQFKVVVGLQNPHRLAEGLLTNVCTKAADDVASPRLRPCVDGSDELLRLAELLRLSAATARTIASVRGRDHAEINELADLGEEMARDMEAIVARGAAMKNGESEKH